MKSLPIINYSYNIKFVPTDTFEFKKYNEAVDLTQYKAAILPKLPAAIKTLYDSPTSRQVVINVNQPDFNTCLLNLQFQMYAGVLYVTANYRAQCEVLGRPHDTKMLKFIATMMANALKTRFVEITCNIGNYHISHLVI